MALSSGEVEIQKLGTKPNGRFLLTAAADSSISLFVLPIEDLLTHAQRGRWAWEASLLFQVCSR